jgi:ATP-dependent Clp protease ATP-binding subunit ClpC
LALAIAQDEAVRLHHWRIEPEHLLLALVKLNSRAGQVLAYSGVDLMRAREIVARTRVGDAAEMPADMTLSPEARRILEQAPAEARERGVNTVEPEHLLLALTREPGSARGVLEEFGVLPEILQKSLLSDH